MGSKQPTWTSPTSSVQCKGDSMLWSLFSWHYWSLFVWECEGAYSNAEKYKVMLETFLLIELHLASKICCGSNKMAQLFIQQKFPFKSSGKCFRAKSLLVSGTSPGLPAPLTMQYQTASSWATLKERYTKHVLPILQTYNSEFLSVFKGSPRKCHNTLLQPNPSRL